MYHTAKRIEGAEVYRYFEMDKDLEKIFIKKYTVVSRLPRRLAGEVEYIEIQLVAWINYVHYW